jgi:hypothetical protein
LISSIELEPEGTKTPDITPSTSSMMNNREKKHAANQFFSSLLDDVSAAVPTEIAVHELAAVIAIHGLLKSVGAALSSDRLTGAQSYLYLYS